MSLQGFDAVGAPVRKHLKYKTVPAREHRGSSVSLSVSFTCLSTPSTRKRLSYVNICKNRNRLRMFHRVVWNHKLPPDYAYQQCPWSSNKSSNIWRFMVGTVLRNISNVSVHTLPYAWPHTDRKTSMALQLMHKSCPMIWNITLWIMRNTREVVCSGLLALVPPQKRTAY